MPPHVIGQSNHGREAMGCWNLVVESDVVSGTGIPETAVIPVPIRSPMSPYEEEALVRVGTRTVPKRHGQRPARVRYSPFGIAPPIGPVVLRGEHPAPEHGQDCNKPLHSALTS